MFESFGDMGIEYYRIDVSKPLEEQKPVDAILHKLMWLFIWSVTKRDQLNIDGQENEDIVKWLEMTRKEHPDIAFVDSLDNLHDFLKRSYSYEVAERAIQNRSLDSVLSVPQYYVLPKGESVRESLKANRLFGSIAWFADMSLPILVKPQWTTGDPSSHAIDVYLDESSLPSSYPFETVIQSYKDHDSVIYKAYAIENHVFLEKRYSLPNAKNCEVGFHSDFHE